MTHEPKTTAIVEFDPIRNAIEAFRAKYGSRVFSVATAEDFADAKAVEKEGRKALSQLEKIRKARKERALRRCQQVDGEARTLREGIGAIFDNVFKLVEVEEERQERERKESARREAQRVAAIRERMERLDPQIPFGANAAVIVAILNTVRANPVDESFDEFEDDAFLIRMAAIDRLKSALEAVEAKEAADAAAAEALRLEREESSRLRAQVEAQEQAAAAAAAAAAAPPAGQLFPVEHSYATSDPTPAVFCRSCLRPLAPAAVDCECGWSMLPGGDEYRPPLSAPGGLKERIAAFNPPRLADDLAWRLIRQAERNRAAADGGSFVPTNFATPELNAAAREAMADYGAEAKAIWKDDAADPPKRQAPVTADYFDDRANDRVRICGVTYPGSFFRAMRNGPCDLWIRTSIRFGVFDLVTIAPDDVIADFDEAAGVLTPEGGSE